MIEGRRSLRAQSPDTVDELLLRHFSRELGA
jgi:hypothetical protein